MDYQGLKADDLANINALNRWFLAVISASRADAFSLIPAQKMTLDERSRLARAPFLLFSFRERDEEYWQQLLDNNPQIDLIRSGERPTKRIQPLRLAALSFLWQLARNNAYAVRLVSGASAGWCERLAGITLVELLQRAAHRRDLLRLRFADDDVVWSRLLGNGRLASHHSALQAMLTRGHLSEPKRLAAAACTMQRPLPKATLQTTGGIREPKV